MFQAVHPCGALSPLEQGLSFRTNQAPNPPRRICPEGRGVCPPLTHYLTRSFFFDFTSLCAWFCSFSYHCSQAVFPRHESFSLAPTVWLLSFTISAFSLCSLQEAKVSDFPSHWRLTSFQSTRNYSDSSSLQYMCLSVATLQVPRSRHPSEIIQRGPEQSMGQAARGSLTQATLPQKQICWVQCRGYIHPKALPLSS